MNDVLKIERGNHAESKYLLVIPRIDGGGPFEPRQYISIGVDELHQDVDADGAPTMYSAYRLNPDETARLVLQFPANFPYVMIANEHVSFVSAEDSLRAEREFQDKARKIIGTDGDDPLLTAPDDVGGGGQYL